MRISSAALFAGLLLIVPAQAQSLGANVPTTSVPTTKILAISHFEGAPMTAAERAAIMPQEVRATLAAYLSGKIDQWYVQKNGRGWCSSSMLPRLKKPRRSWRNSRLARLAG
ncbi:MAG: hypothetical protein ACREFW_09335 [Rhizomicrobium sp.]